MLLSLDFFLRSFFLNFDRMSLRGIVGGSHVNSIKQSDNVSLSNIVQHVEIFQLNVFVQIICHYSIGNFQLNLYNEIGIISQLFVSNKCCIYISSHGINILLQFSLKSVNNRMNIRLNIYMCDKQNILGSSQTSSIINRLGCILLTSI